MTELPPLPPEAVEALLQHLRAAGREVVLGLETVVTVVRRRLAARPGEPDPALSALDETLARVGQGLAFLALLAPAPAAPAGEAAARARREALETVRRLVEGVRAGAEAADPAVQAAREAVLDEVAAALDEALEGAAPPPAG